jgi:uncharacterized membrane protein YqhA
MLILVMMAVGVWAWFFVRRMEDASELRLGWLEALMRLWKERRWD